MNDLAQATTENLEVVEAYLWIVFGIVMSVLVPVAANVLRPKTQLLKEMTPGGRLKEIALPYLKIMGASLVLGVLFVVLFDYEDYRLAFLTGYSWDSTLQKIAKP